MTVTLKLIWNIIKKNHLLKDLIRTGIATDSGGDHSL